MMNVLVTGATGLVGSEVLDRFRSTPGVDAVGTGRRGCGPGIVPWDLAAGPCPPALARRWDAVVHAAADVRWTMAPDEALRANVSTVEALAPVVGPGTRLVHVSTAYACGLRGDGASPDPADYRNTYEWSKAQAERLVRRRYERSVIVRPPLIVGRRGDGRAARFAGMYTILRGIVTSTVPVIAADAEAVADVIPVDDLAGLLVDCALGEDARAASDLHIIAGGCAAPRVGEVVTAMMTGLNQWRTEQGHKPLDAPRIVSPESWNRFFLPFAREHLSPRQNRMLELLRNFEPYFELSAPLRPTHQVADVEGCVRASARYWAGRNPRLAALSPRPWKAAA